MSCILTVNYGYQYVMVGKNNSQQDSFPMFKSVELNIAPYTDS